MSNVTFRPRVHTLKANGVPATAVMTDGLRSHERGGCQPNGVQKYSQVTASPPTFVEDLDVVDLAPSAAFTAEKADTVVNLQDMEASLRGHPDPAREGGNDEGLAEAHPLRHVFDRAAVSGSVAVEQIPDLIRATHPGATDRVIRDAIEEIAPAAPGGFLVNFEQLEEVWHVVLEEMAHEGSSAGSPVATTRGAGWCRPWATCRRAFARRRAGRAPPRETDAKPTKRLLLVATSATSVIALGVASFAVAFFLADTVASSERGLVHTAGLAKDALELFAAKSFRAVQKRNMVFTAGLVGNVVEETGITAAVRTYQSNFLFVQQILGTAMDEGFKVNALSDAREWALNVAGWVAALWGLGEAQVVAVVNAVNRRGAAGTEIVMGRWNAGTRKIVFLTDFRFKDQCKNGACGSDPTAAAPMLAALSGGSGALLGNDYRPHPVYAGYTFIAEADVGVVYKIDSEARQKEGVEQAAKVVDNINLQRRNTLEIVLAQFTPSKQLDFLSALIFCDGCGGCNTTEWVAPDLRDALERHEGAMIVDDYRPELVVSGYGPIRSLGLGVAAQIDLAEVLNNLAASLSRSLDDVNRKPNTTEELMFVTRLGTFLGTDRNTTVLTGMKFADQCVNGTCAHDVAAGSLLRRAVHACLHDPLYHRTAVGDYVPRALPRSSGEDEYTDYRGDPTIATFRCLPFLKGALLLKVDESQINDRGTQISLDYINNQNALTDGTLEMMLARRRPRMGPEDIRNRDDFEFLTEFQLECADAEGAPVVCPDGEDSAVGMTRALQDERGSVRGIDYRESEAVLMAYEPVHYHSGDLGLVLKVDIAELQAPALMLSFVLFMICLGTIVISIVFLAYITKRMLDSIERAWEDGKAEVEHEKQQFSSLVRSLYPPIVSDRLLAGETQIVYNVPHAAVLFSDIWDWTSKSSCISADELIGYLGYTFRVMDGIASFLGVSKVKTIGDAYLAIIGLPGSASENPSLDMLKFASYTAQIFSQRFVHSEQGAILAVVANRKREKKRGVRLAPQVRYSGSSVVRPLPLPDPGRRTTQATMASEGARSIGSRSAQSSVRGPGPMKSGPRSNHSGSINPSNAPSQARSYASSGSRVSAPEALSLVKSAPPGCLMRYGIAAGPVMAGVLQGKTPMFDIWGKTVNLASRMESTGQPGRIQVSEAVHEAVTAGPSPFTFDGHQTYAKGFGQVQAYYVRGTTEAPPKALLLRLELGPFYGAFAHGSAMPEGPPPRVMTASSHGSDRSRSEASQPTSSGL